VVKQPVQNSVLLVAFLLLSAFPAFAQTSPQQLVSQVKRAVVIVTTYDAQKNPLRQGSGFFIGSNRLVTNFHVVESAREIRIKTFTGETASVEIVVAMDRQADLAILQISAPCREISSLDVANISPATRESLGVVNNAKGPLWKVTVGTAATWNFEDLGTKMQITASLALTNAGPVVRLQGHMMGIAAMDR